jgi:hypothetical protein
VGLFSSKKVITTGVAISPLMGDKPNLIRNAIIKATINELPYVPTIVESLLAGYNVDPDAYYRQGLTEKYRLGLPQGNVPRIQDRSSEAKQVIADLEGVSVSSIKFNTQPVYGILSDDFLGRIFTQQVQANYIEPETGIDLIQGADVNGFSANRVAEYLGTGFLTYDFGDEREDETIFVEEQDTDLSITYKVYNPNDRANTEVQQAIGYSLKGNNTPEFLTVTDWEFNLYSCSYQLSNGSGGFLAEKYWSYQASSNLYPSLAIFDEEDLNSPYFPIVPIRINKQMVSPEHDIELYSNEGFIDEVDDILSTVGLGLEQLQTALKDNPDVGDIDDAYVMFNIPFGNDHDGSLLYSSKPQSVLRYCYAYFEYLYNEVQTVDKQTFLASESAVQGTSEAPVYNLLRINDSEFRQILHWNYIEIIDEPWVEVGESGRREGTHRMGGRNFEDISPTETNFYSQAELWFYVYNDEVQTATKIIISGIYTENNVYSNKSVVNTMWDSFIVNADNPKDGLFIPVSYNILTTLSRRDQDEVSFSSLSLVIYALKVTTIKWYKRPAFFKLIRIILFVVAIVTQNYYLLTLDLAVTEVALLIIQSIIINYISGEVLSLIFKVLVDIIGLEASFILAIVAIAYGASVEMGVINPTNLLPDAALILEASSVLTGAVTNKIKKDSFKLLDEFKDLQEDTEKQQEEIEALGFSTDIGIDVNDLVNSVLIRPESPDAFFQRTINPTGGLSTLDTVNYYYDNALSNDLNNI